jgi:hypothetical protein
MVKEKLSFFCSFSQPTPVFCFFLFVDPKFYHYVDAVVAKQNSAPQMKIASDLLTVSNEKGFRMARGSFGASEGSWFFELEVIPTTGNTRLGWSTEKGDIQAPVGYDKYSYSYRDIDGSVVHQSRRRKYGAAYGLPEDSFFFSILVVELLETDSLFVSFSVLSLKVVVM